MKGDATSHEDAAERGKEDAAENGYTPPPEHYVKERMELEPYTIPWIDTAAGLGIQIIDGLVDGQLTDQEKFDKLRLIFTSIQAELAKQFPAAPNLERLSCDKCSGIHDPKKWAQCIANCQ